LEKLEYKKATTEDINELVRTRIIVLCAANKLTDDVDMSIVEKESFKYYKHALETGEHVTLICKYYSKFGNTFLVQNHPNEDFSS